MSALPPSDPASRVEQDAYQALLDQETAAIARGAEVVGFVVEAAWIGGWDKVTRPLPANRAAVHYRSLLDEDHFQARVTMEIREYALVGPVPEGAPQPVNRA